MSLPASAKITDNYIYIDKNDAEEVIADPLFTPIVGIPKNLHGNIIGYYEGKMVILLRVF